mgnify:CR=1 FL=1
MGSTKVQTSASLNASAADALERFALAVPTAELILAGIIESTSASISDMQDGLPKQHGGITNDVYLLEGIAENSAGTSSAGASSAVASDDAMDSEKSENESSPPASKRPKLMPSDNQP